MCVGGEAVMLCAKGLTFVADIELEHAGHLVDLFGTPPIEGAETILTGAATGHVGVQAGLRRSEAKRCC